MNTQVPTSRRVRAIAASATKVMAQEAARIGGCVSLGQGVPSFATPAPVVEAVCRVLRDDPTSGKYTLQTGMPALRQRIARMLHDEKGVTIDPEREICLTVGGMEGLLATMLTVVDEGDEVILPSPTYASYIEQVHLAGGVPVFAPLDELLGPGHRGGAAGDHAAHQSAHALQSGQPHRQRARRGRDPCGLRVGGDARVCSDHRRDLRVPGLW